jgi:hypothetical protein
MKRSLSEVSEQLQAALAEQAKNYKAYEDALEKIRPLEVAAKGSDNAVISLTRELNKLMGVDQPEQVTAAPRRGRPPKALGGDRRSNEFKQGRGGVPGPRKAYNISPETKIAATEKRSYTRAINAGKSKAEAAKLGKAAAKLLKQKLADK